MDRILKRLREPSSYAGLAAITYGFGDLFKIKEAPMIAEGVTQVGQAVVANPTWQGALMGILGVLAFAMGEKGER